MTRIMFSLILLAACADAAAAQPGAPPSVSQGQTRSAGVRARVPYTGMYLSGQPRFSPGGGMRWATYPTVRSVDPGSPAAKLGVAAGDVILLVNGTDGRDPESLVGRPGKVYVFRIRRGNSTRDVTITSIPAPQPSARGGS